MCVLRQAIDHLFPEWSEVPIYLCSHPGHSNTTVGAGNSHAVDARLLDAGESTDRLRHFGGSDVFTFPANRVAHAIDEIEVALFVLSHQVASPEPGVTGLEHVTEYLLLGG